MDLRSDLWEWLNRAQDRGVRPGLARMERLLDALGNPGEELRCLHVAGTNGKGSVCAFAESMLRAAGYRTGFYSSPHLVDFAERFRINGEPASPGEIEAGIRRLQVACSEWNESELPTYFELVTALAFDLFMREGCEIVVLETGLGGRLDATNTVPKIACAITPIALDHMEWLGRNLAEIAREKAGIFRSNVPAVISPQEQSVARALKSQARLTGTSLIWVTEPLASKFRLGLVGSHQRMNAALALELLKAGGFHLSGEEICQGLQAVSWPGRFQRLRDGNLILDGAHNLHAVQQLVETWHEEFGDRKCSLIFGALADKDPEELLAVLEPIAEEIFLVPVSSSRSMNPEHFRERFQMPHRICSSLSEALNRVVGPPSRLASGYQHLTSNSHPSPVLLTGSLFLVGEALALESGAVFIPRSQ